MIVLDASAALELLLRTNAGAEIARRIAPVNETLHAPHVIDLVARFFAVTRRAGT